ncbi:MAG: hypothetical protein PHC69_10585 [Ruminiclostridium sp.]|nr:hypothetical protein [Ruminiclostridium sp.]
MRKGKKIIAWILAVVALIVGILIWFIVPYSPTKTEFEKLIKFQMTKTTTNQDKVFTNEDIAELPLPVQKYFQYCGYIGTPKMQTMKAIYKDVKFKFSKEKPTIIIDYVQYNIADEPARIAYIDSSMYGIPFEGLDSYIAGKGTMKGVLAKLITLFNQAGVTMDKASLVTFLSECLIIPNAAIQEYITWEEIDSLHAMATISYYGRTASGIFAFNEKGEMCSFTTNDREATSIDGKSEEVKWSVGFGGYVETNGIKKPTEFQAIWHYEGGDLLYFDGKDVAIEYDKMN